MKKGQPYFGYHYHEAGEQHPLTPREWQVAMLIADGAGRRGVAVSLGISYCTVRAHMSHLFKKTSVHNSAGLAMWVYRNSEKRFSIVD